MPLDLKNNAYVSHLTLCRALAKLELRSACNRQYPYRPQRTRSSSALVDFEASRPVLRGGQISPTGRHHSESLRRPVEELVLTLLADGKLFACSPVDLIDIARKNKGF